MISNGDSITPTRAVGLFAYGLATVCCLVASARISGRAPRRVAAWMSAIEALLLLDIIFDLRWHLHDWLGSLAQSHQSYQLRRFPQLVVDLSLLAILLYGVSMLLRVGQRGGVVLALAGVMLSIATWCFEVVSLHQLDAVLYSKIGPFMVVSALWAFAALATSVGMLMAMRENKNR